MKYLNLFVIALLAFVLSACSKNDNPGPGQTDDLPQVKSITFNGTAYATLSYNNRGQLTSISYVNILDLADKRGDKFTYDVSGRLLKAVNAIDSTNTVTVPMAGFNNRTVLWIGSSLMMEAA